MSCWEKGDMKEGGGGGMIAVSKQTSEQYN